MITDTMTISEIRDEMKADHGRLLRRLGHSTQQWRRKLLKHQGGVVYEHGEWNSPVTNNRWLWSARIYDRRMRFVGLTYGILRYRQQGMEFLLYLPADADYGEYGDLCTMQHRLNGVDSICRYSSHCWRRVRERVPGMHRYYGRELVERILSPVDNDHFIVTKNTEAQNATGRQMEDTLQMVTQHGVFLGFQPAPDFIHFNTFISHRQTQGRQREIIGAMHQRILEAKK